MSNIAEDLKGKVIFWDIDGTLVEYRFNGKANWEHFEEATPEETYNFYANRGFPKCMRNLINKLNKTGCKYYILGHYGSDAEIKGKVAWLKQNFPEVDGKNRMFLDRSMSKGKAILKIAEKDGINVKDIVFIDDRHEIVIEAENLGIKSYHASSLLELFE